MSQPERSPRGLAAEFFLLLGLLCLAFVAALVAVVWLGYAVRLPLTKVQPLLALLLVLFLPVIGRNLVDLALQWRAGVTVAFLGLFASAIFFSTSLHDVTCDGQGYHGTAIVHLLEGWNPLWEWRRPQALQEIIRDAVIYFAKGPWYAAAALSRLTGNIEAGKATTMLLFAGCVFVALHGLLRHTRLHPGLAGLLATLIGANPVTLSQIFSHYIDGQGAVLFTAVVLGSVLLLVSSRVLYAIVTALAIALLMNVKLNAVPYVIVFGATFAATIWMRRRRDVLLRFVVTYAAGIAAGLLIGANPYLTNLIVQKNPFHPFSPSGKKYRLEYNVYYHQMPVTFRDRNRFERLFLSAFSEVENDYDLASLTFRGSSLKIPFTVTKEELREFRNVDARIGGWGPLAGGILLFSIAALGLGRGEKVKTYRWWCVGLLLCVFATIFVVPHTWAARYVPQLWLVPVLVVVTLFLAEHRLSRVLAGILVALMLANLAMVAVPAYREQLRESTLLRKQLRMLAAEGGNYPVFFGDLVMNRQRFREAGIQFREVPSIPAEKEFVLAGDALLTGRTVVERAP